MQDRYVGDVGDFAKYALVRRLCGLRGERPVRLGIIWCRFPDENHNADGKHISYLGDEEFRKLDGELITALGTIVDAGRRSISSVVTAGILPRGTVSYEVPVSSSAGRRRSRNASLLYRSEWLKRGLNLMVGCDLVFFDPDNGIEISSIPKHHPKAGKYIYWDELTSFWECGKTLLIYHHLNRTASAARQVAAMTDRFADNFDRATTVPLVFRRGSSRVFWLIHRADDLGRELESRAVDLLNGGWSRHYRPFGWPS